MSAATLRVILLVLVDMLAVAGGVAMFMQTGEILWALAGAALSGMITLLFLVPALREAQAERKDGTLVR